MWLLPNRCCYRDCFQSAAATACIGDRLGVQDPDVSYWLPRGEIHESLMQAWHATVGLMGGAAFVSEPTYESAYQTPEAIRMQEILTPPAPERGASFDGGCDPDGRRFGIVADRPWGQWAVVRLFNPDDEACQITLPPAIADMLENGADCWSFWDQQHLGMIDANWPGVHLESRHGHYS